jgi:carboxypeptidase Q
MKERLKIIAILVSLCVVNSPLCFPQERNDSGINEMIRGEEVEHSQIMRTLHYLSDLYGPRLTGSPNLRAAEEWAVKQMKDWELDNAHLEPWTFGHPGWVNERASGFIVSPVKDSLTFKVLAWTPGTKGAVQAEAYQVIPPEKPTQEQLKAYFDGIKDKVAGKIVLAGRHIMVPVNLNQPKPRLDDEDLRQNFDPDAKPTAATAAAPPKATGLTSSQISDQLDGFLLESGALVRINDAGRPHGQIRAFNNPAYDVDKALPTVVLRNEDYGRISRLLADGQAVSLEFNIQNRLFPEGATEHNVIGEVPGSDKTDEVVMLGAHLDSWHSATGATDNAIGCAMMMEAIRLLKSAGVRPRRTIRVALWSGEEEGLLGSQAYIKEHFGSFEHPKPDFFKLDCYINIDTGTGRARGMWVFGPSGAAATLREAIGPFAYLGVDGVGSYNSRELSGSDHTSFNYAGLTSVRVVQDQIEYGDTWHTNMDTYERIIEGDAKKSAIVIAAAVYQLAMRDALLPRFSSQEMPAIPLH